MTETIIAALSAFGALGSLAALLKVQADNNKTRAEAKKIETESLAIAIEQLMSVNEDIREQLDDCLSKR